MSIKSKERVIHIVHNLQVGGVETAVRSSVDQLNVTYDFWVVTLHPSNSDFIANLEFKERIVCFNLHSFFAPFNLIRLIWFVLKLKPKLILTSLWKSHAISLLIGWFESNIRIIPIIHSSVFFHKLDRFFTLNILKKVNLVLCDSSSSKTFIDNLVPDINTQVLSFKISQNDKVGEINKSFKFGVFNAVFIGRLSSEKRLDRAIKLIEGLAKKGITVSFDIYGPDHQMERILRVIAGKLPLNIKIHGAVPPDQVNDVLSNYHFFIQLSDVEGMAITVVQAMQLGLIPIVSKVGEMQFYVKHQQNGLVLLPPFEDLDDIINQITELVKLPNIMNQMSENAKYTFTDQPLYSDHLKQLLKQQIGA